MFSWDLASSVKNMNLELPQKEQPQPSIAEGAKRPSDVEPKEPKRVLHIEMDDVPAVDEFVTSIASLPVREQVSLAGAFIKSQFKSAMPPDPSRLSSEEQAQIAQVFDQRTTKKLSSCVGGYGVCVEYHVLGKAIFDKLGIPNEFMTGRVEGGLSHTYLDIQIDGQWEIFDPFAEVYLSDRKSTATRFMADYYTKSRMVSENRK